MSYNNLYSRWFGEYKVKKTKKKPSILRWMLHAIEKLIELVGSRPVWLTV